ncbi:MAG: ribonuclease H-like YkuK family protein [Chitinophagales bacterium]
MNAFIKMGNSQKIDLAEYICQYRQLHPDVEIYVGCDSQNYSRYTVYVSTVLFRFYQNGAHVVYKKEKVNKITAIWPRLWGELERSVDLASYIREHCGYSIKQIDLDFNKSPEFPSFKVYKAAVGYAESMGFTAKAKPDLLFATSAANFLCH